jgi:histidinol phosphatase-like enzyme
MRRCVFLDRDGVINLKPAPSEYIRAWAEIRLTPSRRRLATAVQYSAPVGDRSTYQRGMALGQVVPTELARIHDNMKQELLRLGDLTQSLLIGDSPRDEELALACGMSLIAVYEGAIAGVVKRQAREFTVHKLAGIRTQ